MATESELGETFLKVTVKALAAYLLPMPAGAVAMAFEELVGPFCKDGWAYLQRLVPSDRELAIAGLIKTDPHRARSVLRTELERTRLDETTKARLIEFLAYVPMRARSAIGSYDDQNGSATLLTVGLKDQKSLAKYLPLRPPQFAPGWAIPSHDYRLLNLLGQGGFGEVWSASNPRRPGRAPVAVKFCLDRKLASSLEHEVQLLELLSGHSRSEYVVELLETGLTADPPFLIFEYVDGGDLTAWLATFGPNGLDEKEVLRILTMTARGLRRAHERGVVHQDLKPSNLLVTRGGQIKIADFGIGHLVQDAAPPPGGVLDQVTALLGSGTPMYMDGEPCSGKQRDVYALGVIAYQLLVGDITRPVPAGWSSKLALRGTSSELTAIVARCLDIPTLRFPDAIALSSALEPLDRTRSPATPPPGGPGEQKRSSEPSVGAASSAKVTASSSRWLVRIAGIVTVSVVGLVQWFGDREAKTAKTPTSSTAGISGAIATGVAGASVKATTERIAGSSASVGGSAANGPGRPTAAVTPQSDPEIQLAQLKAAASTQPSVVSGRTSLRALRYPRPAADPYTNDERVSGPTARQVQAAREAYDRGQAAYIEAAYNEAAQWFETANRMAPTPGALSAAIGSHLRNKSETRAATLALELQTNYQESGGLVTRLLAIASTQLVRVAVSCDEDCKLDVNGKLQEYLDFFVEPKTEYQVTATFETGSMRGIVRGAAGETRSLDFIAPAN